MSTPDTDPIGRIRRSRCNLATPLLSLYKSGEAEAPADAWRSGFGSRQRKPHPIRVALEIETFGPSVRNQPRRTKR